MATDKLEFQILDWDEYQYVDTDNTNDDDSQEQEENKIFIVRLFGKTKDQKSVYLEVTDFKPYFYIEIRSNWSPMVINEFMEKVKENVWPKKNVEGLFKYEQVKKCRFYGFTNYTKFTFLQLNFNNVDSLKSYERALKKMYNIPHISKKPIKVKIYESNLLPMLRLMHIQKMSAVGTITVDKNKLSEDTYLTSCNELNYKTNWKNIQPIEEFLIERYIILSFDLECISEDGSFPQASREGDKIVQISMTLSRYGEDDCYEKYLLALGETSEIEGVIVKWYNTEEELLLGFTQTLRELNPDVVTGYNIFGFDWPYIIGRGEK
jgi:DNA polymerase delta subunit 1